MEDILTNVSNITDTADLRITEVVGNWFLYSLSLFVELSVTMLACVLIYRSVHSMAVTYKYTKLNDPINVYKLMKICLCSTIFLRAIMDAIMLLVWNEVSPATLINLVNLDRFTNGLAMVPFFTYIYLLLRTGPSIEYQLLRQPLPLNLHPTWKSIRKTILVLITVLVLSILITLSK